jgi:threonine dehydrogenase-like Zn-dependent dehydrogenase
MKAFVYHGANSGSVEERPDPVPAEGELLVEVLVTGICGSDIHGYSGDTGRRFPGQVMGHEASGRVIDPNGTPGWAEGDRLTFNPVLGCQECAECMSGRPNLCARRSVIGVNAPYTGSFAERMTLPAWAAVRLPETVSDDGGAVVEPLAVGLHAVGQAEVHKGDHVAVLGAGMIGLVSAWAALRAEAAEVFVTDFQRRNLDLAQSFGAIPVDARTSLADAIEAKTGRRTVDRVIDAVGVTETLSVALGCARRDGTISVVGMGSPTAQISAFALTVEERTLRGSFCYSPANFYSAIEAISDGAFNPSIVIDRHIPLDDLPSSMLGLSTGTASSVKTLVRLTAEASLDSNAGPAASVGADGSAGPHAATGPHRSGSSRA